jgi:hypothetical protein
LLDCISVVCLFICSKHNGMVSIKNAMLNNKYNARYRKSKRFVWCNDAYSHLYEEFLPLSFLSMRVTRTLHTDRLYS